MSKLFYNLSVKFYSVLIYLAAFFNEKAKKFIQGRKGQWSSIRKAVEDNKQPIAWFHCASLGEFEQGRPVIEGLKKQRPDFRIFLSFFSPSGYEVRKNYEGADFIFYLPMDSRKNAGKLLALLNPAIAIFVKYEFWYHYLHELHSRQIPVILISAIFRSNQLFFRKYGTFYRSMLNFYQQIFVQNQASAELLDNIQIKKVQLAGDTRFDRVVQIFNNRRQIEIAERFKAGDQVMVMGSTWMSDIEVLKHLVSDSSIELKYIIAPHNISEQELNLVERDLQQPCIRFSKAGTANLAKYRVLLIDNMGMLSSLYQYGMMAYIGGAFRKALHNTLEAATYGIPVLFGEDESNSKFQEAKELESAGAAFAVRNQEELVNTVKKLITDQKLYQSAANAARSYIDSKTGATGIILKSIERLI